MTQEKIATLYMPSLRGLYDRASPLAEAALRIVTGALLVAHGSQKIVNPTGAVDLVQMIGFYPPAAWSVLLSVTEFFGGILVLVGLFTRPAAFATSIILLVTIWFHWIVVDQGLEGAEKSILWFAVLVYFCARGGGGYSLDARIGREI